MGAIEGCENDTPRIMRELTEVIRTDPEYAWSWHCNIAIAFQDEGGEWEASNRAAARFMRSLFGVEPAHPINREDSANG
jgi:hypothetical protein